MNEHVLRISCVLSITNIVHSMSFYLHSPCVHVCGGNFKNVCNQKISRNDQINNVGFLFECNRSNNIFQNSILSYVIMNVISSSAQSSATTLNKSENAILDIYLIGNLHHNILFHLNALHRMRNAYII